MVTVTNDFEGGTNGTTVSTSNAGGTGNTQFNTVSHGTGTTVQFSDEQAAHGGLSVKMASGATASGFGIRWTTAVGTATTSYIRFYFYATGAPASNTRLIQFGNASGSTVNATVYWQTNRKFATTNSGIGGGVATTATVPLNQWVRIEVKVVVNGASGTHEIRVYLTPDSATADSTNTASAQNNGTTAVGLWAFGNYFDSKANVPAFYMDDVGVSTTDWLGPAVSGPATVTGDLAASATGTLTAAGTGKATGAAGLAAVATQALAGIGKTTGAAAVSGTGSFTAAGYAKTTGALSPSAAGSFVASATTQAAGAALPLAAGATLTAAGFAKAAGAVPLAATGTFAAAGFAKTTGAAGLAAAATQTITGRATATSALSLAADSGIEVAGSRIVPPKLGAASMSALGSFSLMAGPAISFGQLAPAGSADLALAGAGASFGLLAATATGGMLLLPDTTQVYHGELLLVGEATYHQWANKTVVPIAFGYLTGEVDA